MTRKPSANRADRAWVVRADCGLIVAGVLVMLNEFATLWLLQYGTDLRKMTGAPGSRG